MAVLQHPKSGRTVTVPADATGYYEGLGWVAPGSAPSEPPVTVPDGEPSTDWKVAEITAYVERESLDVGDATKKADLLAAIAAARDTK